VHPSKIGKKAVMKMSQELAVTKLDIALYCGGMTIFKP
jgi:hypothetical protein